MRYWEEQLLKQARSESIKDQLLSLPEETQRAYFHHLITDESPEQLVIYAKRLLQRKYRKITEQIKAMAWVNERLLFDDIYRTYTNREYQQNSPPHTG